MVASDLIKKLLFNIWRAIILQSESENRNELDSKYLETIILNTEI